jgi:NitT/TauT family transport system permease protein
MVSRSVGKVPSVERAGPALRKRLSGVALWRRAAELLAFGVVLLLAWQAAYSLRLLSRFVLPAPVDTLQALGTATKNLLSAGYVLHATLYTLAEVAAGFGIAALAGVALGVIVGDTAVGRRVVMPYVIALNAMPKIAFAPVFVAWLGFGISPKIVMVAFIAFFPMVINTALGLSSVTANSLLLFRALESTRWQTLLKLKFRAALPSIFAGFKTASSLAVIGAIVGEFLGGSAKGLGELIRISSQNLETADVFAYIFILSVVGVLIYAVIALVERRVVYWRSPSRPGGRG